MSLVYVMLAILVTMTLFLIYIWLHDYFKGQHFSISSSELALNRDIRTKFPYAWVFEPFGHPDMHPILTLNVQQLFQGSLREHIWDIRLAQFTVICRILVSLQIIVLFNVHIWSQVQPIIYRLY